MTSRSFCFETEVECISDSSPHDDLKWYVARMRVPGGWLVTNAARQNEVGETHLSISTTFVADVDGQWETTSFEAWQRMQNLTLWIGNKQ